MGKRILVPVDGSPQSRSAVELVADEWPDAAVTFLHVIDPVTAGRSGTFVPSGSEEWYRNARQDARDLFEELGETLGGDYETRTEVGRPARTIVEVIAEERHDHVVMGSHGRKGVSRILLGSTAEHVLRNSPVPVTIVR
ncbi:universal stress protein [Salinigranum sp.]|uniref:universal stress protein n=1 Tax=Salinigranum sp. TaxID=1966351 RepID=UPI00356B1134